MKYYNSKGELVDILEGIPENHGKLKGELYLKKYFQYTSHRCRMNYTMFKILKEISSPFTNQVLELYYEVENVKDRMKLIKHPDNFLTDAYTFLYLQEEFRDILLEQTDYFLYNLQCLDELMHVFKPEEASIINFLNNFNTKTVFFEKSCGKDKKTVISLYESKVDIAPNNDNVVISGKLNARVNEDNCDYNLKDDDSYKILQKDFNKIIEEKVNEVIDQLKAYESNVLSIGKNYYNKYRKKYYYRWTDQDFKYDFDLKINKKGLVFTVK